MSKQGFTLIELLVVIAIIGILASIVLVTFPTAQNRAKDARIISALGQMRTSMTLYLDDYDVFDDGTDNLDCTYGDMVNLCAEVTDMGGTTNIVLEPVATISDTACIYSALNTGGKFFCVDSSGQTYEGTTNPNTTCAVGTGYVCP